MRRHAKSLTKARRTAPMSRTRGLAFQHAAADLALAWIQGLRFIGRQLGPFSKVLRFGGLVGFFWLGGFELLGFGTSGF